MNGLIGMWFMFFAVIIGCICLFGMDFTLKQKIWVMVQFEMFITALIVGAYFLSKWWGNWILSFRRYKAEWKRFSAAGVCSYSRMIYQIRFSALLLSRCLDIVINQTGSCAWRHLSRCRQNDNGMSDSDGKISILKRSESWNVYWNIQELRTVL